MIDKTFSFTYKQREGTNGKTDKNCGGPINN